jgi:hypothetical protein
LSETERTVCAACSHEIDATARVCPYCGADPQSGEKMVDTQAIIEEVFHPNPVSKSEGVLEYARQRQGIIAVIAAFVAILLLSGLHSFVTHRNEKNVSAAAAVPLTDVADLNNQSEENRPQPMPELQFQYDGNSRTMRTLIVEPGAVTPPEVVAAQQAAAQQATQQRGAQQAAAQPAPAAPPRPTPH